jgi:hypothetical protein
MYSPRTSTEQPPPWVNLYNRKLFLTRIIIIILLLLWLIMVNYIIIIIIISDNFTIIISIICVSYINMLISIIFIVDIIGKVSFLYVNSYMNSCMGWTVSSTGSYWTAPTVSRAHNKTVTIDIFIITISILVFLHKYYY